MEFTPSLLALSISLVVFIWLKKNRKAHAAVPAMGPEGIFSSYLGALEYLKNAPKIIQKGYNQHKPMFRVPYPDKWMYVLSSARLIADLRKAPEHELSPAHGFGATLAVKYTLGMRFVETPYHEMVVRRELTRSSNERLLDVWDEVVCAFGDEVGVKLIAGGGWVALPALETVLRIVSRTSNRLFVGVELCRNADYRDLTIEYAENVIKRARIINLFPDALKPIVGPLVSPLRRGTSRASKHLAPIIEERLRKEETHDEDVDPNDLISWLITHAPADSPEEKTIPALIQRIMQINFLAVHTTANSFTQALYHLAAEPRYVAPLREEVEAALSQENGWSKATLGRCCKLDSFLRESQRFNGVSAINMHRKVLSPSGFTFSDGTHLPMGTYITAATYATHHDEGNYQDAEKFDGFRFARMREAEESEGSGSSKYQMSTPDPAFLAFGLGKHACPGRFFAVTELKLMLAYILLQYDIRLEEEGVRPPSEWFGTTCGANRSAKVLFRKRFET
ncbi:cytochrome P450 [Roridomyces roridus]|uniref:Cytochrome P450 n=1 Tax=Roridomyces roridus TaxID=1738132 RepID=A0AAD7BHN8_9AGAR|nr:cytochrome P450 [Roridomyces roridus]